MRKSETVLTCKRDSSGNVTLFTSQARNCPIFEKDGPRFAWDESAGMPMSIETKRVQSDREEIQDLTEKLVQMADGDPLKVWRHGEFVDQWAKVHGVSESTAKRKFGVTKVHGLLTLNSATGYYSLGSTVQNAIKASKQAE